MTNSEDIVSQINKNIFFKEFTFSKTDFKSLDTKQQLEFADNIVWLDDIFFVYQIKQKEANSDNYKSWFNNKILGKAVKQIKSTLSFINTHSEIIIQNEKGHRLNIAEAQNNEIKKLIIYEVDKDFPEQLRNQKFYESTSVGLIHLFHSEDYYWICKYLITPAEVEEYLSFREKLYLYDKLRSNHLPEQYFLGHFMETLNADHFNASYINNLKNKKYNIEDFDISGIIENFSKNIKLINHETEYYAIIKEIAKLNRSELIEFKKRVSYSIENCEKNEFNTPYRIYVPATDCAFVFIPLHSNKAQYWKTALYNYTMAQKYNTKATKCIGVVIFKNKTDTHYYEFYWQYAEGVWYYDEVIEKALSDNFPFRETKTKRFDNRYK